MDTFLKEQKVGRLATINADGSPYITPVHFICRNKYIYIHGLCKGQKIENIKNTSQVCFEIDEMTGLIPDEKPCDVNTAYRSVIISGNVRLIEWEPQIIALKGIVQKYTPHLSDISFLVNMIKATAVIEISIQNITGKYYK